MKIVAFIPAHLASVRFPRKILFPFHGLPMIEHVRRRALLCAELADVIVATCDAEIAATIRRGGGRVIMTRSDHASGTTRVAEAVAAVDCTHVILLQGDEPLLLPRHVEACIAAIHARPDGDAWNVTGPIDAAAELDRHSFVKCAVAPDGRIMYCFRRTPSVAPLHVQQEYIRKILGIIAFRKEFLLDLTALTPARVEQAELIEQMRIIEHGYRLQSVPVQPSLPSVNEPDEADIVLRTIAGEPEQVMLLERVLRGEEEPA